MGIMHVYKLRFTDEKPWVYFCNECGKNSIRFWKHHKAFKRAFSHSSKHVVK